MTNEYGIKGMAVDTVQLDETGEFSRFLQTDKTLIEQLYGKSKKKIETPNIAGAVLGEGQDNSYLRLLQTETRPRSGDRGDKIKDVNIYTKSLLEDYLGAGSSFLHRRDYREEEPLENIRLIEKESYFIPIKHESDRTPITHKPINEEKHSDLLDDGFFPQSRKNPMLEGISALTPTTTYHSATVMTPSGNERRVTVACDVDGKFPQPTSENVLEALGFYDVNFVGSSQGNITNGLVGQELVDAAALSRILSTTSRGSERTVNYESGAESVNPKDKRMVTRVENVDLGNSVATVDIVDLSQFGFSSENDFVYVRKLADELPVGRFKFWV